MATRSERVQLGIFMTIAGVLFAGVFVLFAGVKLFRSEDKYRIYFEDSVSGLSVGSQVRYKGVRVGSVSDVMLEESGERVEVKISIREGLPLPQGTQAVLASQGVTGVYFLSLEGGDKDKPPIPPGSVIPAGEGFMQKMTARAERISGNADELVERLTNEQNMQRIEATLARTESLVKNVDTMVVELTSTIQVGRRFVETHESELAEAVERGGQAAREIEALARESRISLASARNVWESSDIPGLIKSANRTVTTFETKLADVPLGPLAKALERSLLALEVVMLRVGQSLGQNQDQLRAALMNLRLASDEIKELSRSLREEPSRIIFSDPPPEREAIRE